MKLRYLALGSLFFTTTLVSTAGAEEEAENSVETTPSDEVDDRAGRKMDLRVPTSPAPAPRTAFVHEGFYFRAGVGPGLMHTSIADRQNDSSAGSAAFSLAAHALVGGSPAPGLALGGGALAQLGLGSSFDGAKSGVFHVNVGPFFDAFPNSKKGFHLGALLGLSAVTLSTEVTPQAQLWGGGAAAWLGWDTWVAPEWSVGIQLQSGGSYVGAPEVGASVFHANLLISLLQH